MGTLSLFLLGVAAVLGTIMIIKNPFNEYTEMARGKTKSELTEALQASGDGGRKGCTFLVFLVLGLFYGFVVEPIAVLYALSNDIGSRMVGYLVLMIVAFWWIEILRPKSSVEKVKVVKVEGDILEWVEDEKFIIPARPIMAIRQVIFSLPTLYLWYLFLVGLKVL